MELKANILRIERLSLSDGKGMRTVVFFKGLSPALCLVFDTGVAVGAAGSLLYERALHRDAAPASRSVRNRHFAGAKKRERS